MSNEQTPDSRRANIAFGSDEPEPRPSIAYLVVDAQNDFSEGGALAVDGAIDAFRAMRLHTVGRAGRYSVLATTRDNHIDPGTHFALSPNFVDTWPVHCQADTPGADYHTDAKVALDLFEQLNPHAPRIDVTKGEFDAAYSGFEGHTAVGVSLADALRAAEVEELDVVGIATDHCVRATVLDALKEGFVVRVLTNQIAAVDPERGQAALDEMEKAGAVIV